MNANKENQNEEDQNEENPSGGGPARSVPKVYPRIGDLEHIHPKARRHPASLETPYRVAIVASITALGRGGCACEQRLLLMLAETPENAPCLLDASDFRAIAEVFSAMARRFKGRG